MASCEPAIVPLMPSVASSNVPLICVIAPKLKELGLYFWYIVQWVLGEMIECSYCGLKVHSAVMTKLIYYKQYSACCEDK